MSWCSWSFEVCRVKNGQSLSNPCVRRCTSSSQAQSVWDIPAAEKANPSLLLLVTLNGSMLRGSSLFEKLTGGGQESIKTSITKALSGLEILPLFCS